MTASSLSVTDFSVLTQRIQKRDSLYLTGLFHLRAHLSFLQIRSKYVTD